VTGYGERSPGNTGLAPQGVKYVSPFPNRIGSSENLVRIPHWKHVLISSWYSRKNELYNNMTPRNYLRGNEQYKIGLQVLRDFGVVK